MGKWRKSSYSTGNGGSCVEVTEAAGTVRVRDTKEASLGEARTIVDFTPTAWDGFLARVRKDPQRTQLPHK